MSETLGRRGADGEGRRIAGSIGVACQNLWTTREEIGEMQPIVNGAGVILAMDGRLDNRDELLRALDLPANATDAQCALAAYEAWGDRFAERLKGDFALAVIDPSVRHLLLVRDPIGIRPLYYHRSDRLFAFASEMKALLAHPDVPTRIDDDGVADLMALGFRPVDRQEVTCFAGIRSLVPAHLAVITPDRTVVRRYWDFDTGRALRVRSFDEGVEAFREHFATAVRRRLRSAHPVAISVSGGIDSSSIFCQALQLQRAGSAACPAVIGISYVGPDGSDADERKYLSAIERQYGVQIDRFPTEPFIGLIQGVEDQVRAIEAPMFDYMWSLTGELHRRARGGGARMLLSGAWGDQMLFSSAYLVDLARQFAWGEIRRHLKQYARWLGSAEARILARRFAVDFVRHQAPSPMLQLLKWVRLRLSNRSRSKQWLSDRFRQRAMRFAAQPALIGNGFHSAQARSLYFEARSKYHVHCMEWNNKAHAWNGLNAAFPFLDRDLLAFLMAIPGEIQNHEGVPRALIREALRGVLPEPVRTRKGKGDFTGLINRGMADGSDAMLRELSPSSLAVQLGYFDADRLGREAARLATNLTGPDCVNSWDLADLFGLEMWLRVFLTAPDRSGLGAHATIQGGIG